MMVEVSTFIIFLKKIQEMIFISYKMESIGSMANKRKEGLGILRCNGFDYLLES